MSRKPRAFKICGRTVANCYYPPRYGARVSLEYWGLDLKSARRLQKWLADAIEWMEEKEKSGDDQRLQGEG